MPLLLSRRDARRAAQACRALAAKHRQDAARLNGASGAQILAAEADAFDRLAQLLEAHAGNVAPVPQATRGR